MNRLLLLKGWSAALFIAALGWASGANATVRFTYDSGPLPWQLSEVNDNTFFDIGAEEKPFFSISFDAPDSWLTPGTRRDFSIPEPSVRIEDNSRVYTVSNAFYPPAMLEIGEDGNISGWFFGYKLSPVFTASDDPAVIAANKYYEFSSTANFGRSCACDVFDIVTNYVGEGPDPVRGPLYQIYSNTNIEGAHWSVSQISAVPEPASYAMLMGGLGLFGVMGWRKRPIFSRPMQAALA